MATPQPVVPQPVTPAAVSPSGPAQTAAAEPAKNKAAAPQPQVQPSAQPSPALAQLPPSPAGAGTVYGEKNLNPRVILKAQGDTHVTVKGASGMVYINRNLTAGDSYRLPNLVGLSLSATNGGALEVDLDGQKMGMAGNESQNLTDLPMDPQAIADRYSH